MLIGTAAGANEFVTVGLMGWSVKPDRLEGVWIGRGIEVLVEATGKDERRMTQCAVDTERRRYSFDIAANGTVNARMTKGSKREKREPELLLQADWKKGTRRMIQVYPDRPGDPLHWLTIPAPEARAKGCAARVSAHRGRHGGSIDRGCKGEVADRPRPNRSSDTGQAPSHRAGTFTVADHEAATHGIECRKDEA